MEDTDTKRLLTFLAAVLLFAAFGQAWAEEVAVHSDSHETQDRVHGTAVISITGSEETHHTVTSYDLYCVDCGRVIAENYKTEEADEPHAWKSARIEPTCEEEGEEIRLCSLCGMEVRIKLPRTGHSFVGASQLMRRETGPVQGSGEYAGLVIGTVNITPTCTESGSGTLICVQCQNASQTVSIPALGHQWGEWEDVPVASEKICVTPVSVMRRCQACGEEERQEIAPAPGHQWQEIARIEPDCTEPGVRMLQCDVCHSASSENLPALGHIFGEVSQLVKQQQGAVRGSGENANKTVGRVNKPSTCAEEGSGVLVCLRCQSATQSVIIPRGEHDWGPWEEAEIPPELVCVTDVTGTHICLNCGEEESQVLVPAPGHRWVAIRFQEPTCTEAGQAVRQCAVCKAEESFDTPAMGHSYMWVDLSTPSPSASGVREYVCTICGDVAQSQSVAYAQMYYNNTITSFGPMTRELLGGSVWYRVTPLDISEDGVFTYPLIASNLYTVGTATVVIDQGIQTVSYRLNSSRITVHTESLVLYPDLDSLRTGENAVLLTFDDPIVLTEYFGEDTKVIMAITLRADYDAQGAGVQGFSPDQELIKKMIELVD